MSVEAGFISFLVGGLNLPARYPAGSPLHPSSLKSKQRDLRDGFPTALTLRVHRALSWLTRAEDEHEDLDVRFILLWIGFNAAYAGDLDEARERDHLRIFFEVMVRLDAGSRIYDMVWQRFSQEIRVLLDNRYVFAPFWKHHNGIAGNEDWAEKLERAWHVGRHAMEAKDTPRILSILFDRLYVLRNQLVHGGATWNSAVNRDQVRDGASILGCLLPIFIDLMMSNPAHDWVMPHYPVVED